MKTRRTLFLDDETNKKLDGLCQKTGLTISQVVQFLLKQEGLAEELKKKAIESLNR